MGKGNCRHLQGERVGKGHREMCTGSTVSRGFGRACLTCIDRPSWCRGKGLEKGYIRSLPCRDYI